MFLFFNAKWNLSAACFCASYVHRQTKIRYFVIGNRDIGTSHKFWIRVWILQLKFVVRLKIEVPRSQVNWIESDSGICPVCITPFTNGENGNEQWAKFRIPHASKNKLSVLKFMIIAFKAFIRRFHRYFYECWLHSDFTVVLCMCACSAEWVRTSKHRNAQGHFLRRFIIVFSWFASVPAHADTQIDGFSLFYYFILISFMW